MGGSKCTYSKARKHCGRKHFARGLCQAHYMRHFRYGDPGEVVIAKARVPKLKPHQVLMARKRVAAGKWTRQEAADYFGVHYNTMCEAIRGKTFCYL